MTEVTQTPTAVIQSVPHNEIAPSPLNPRKVIGEEQLRELAASIKQEGLLQNLVVRRAQGARLHHSDPKYEIAAGERRWRAISQLIEAGDLPAEHEIPVVVRNLTDLQLLQLATAENLARADMSPLEEARAFQQMLALGSDVATISAETGLSERTVNTRLALVTRLAPAAIEVLEAGGMTLGQAQALTLGSFEAQERLLATTTYDGRSMLAVRTPAGVRAAVTAGAVPVSRAKFPLERYRGELTPVSIFDPEGAETFVDVDEFHRLQREYAEELLEEAKRSWAWAELVTGYFSEFAYDTVTDESDAALRAQAGVVIQLNEGGELTVREGLVKRSARVDTPAAGGVVEEPETAAPTKRHLEVANQHRARALQEVIYRDSSGATAMVVAVMGMLASWWPTRLRRDGPAPALDDAALALRADIDAHFDGLGNGLIHAALSGEHVSSDRHEDLAREIWDLPTDLLERLFRAVVALNVRMGNQWVPGAAPDDAMRFLWRATSAEEWLPTLLDLGSEWLQLYSKPGLEQVAEAAGVAGVSGTRKEIAGRVLGSNAPSLREIPELLRVSEEEA